METNRISLQEFGKTFLLMGCFSGEQVRLWKPDFCRDNVTRWIAAGEILRLKRNFNQGKMLDYEKRIHSPALTRRINLLREAYDLL
jgi:predicted transcriptional regulator of viral defense system